MKLFKKDMFSDYYFSFYRDNKYIQSEGYKRIEFNYDSDFTEEVSSFYHELMSITDIVRVSDNEFSPYKIHKSYPSARSYYNQKIWLNISKNKFISKDSYSNIIKSFSPKDRVLDVERIDLLITTELITLKNYQSINKSLSMLEFGHILYNIHNICNVYGIQIENILVKDYGIIVNFFKNKIDIHDVQEIEQIHSLYYLRSSGPYYRGLLNFEESQRECFFDFQLDIEDVFKKLFHEDLKKYIKILNFKNDGKCFIFEKISLEYFELAQEYTYIDFRSCSQFTLFLLDKTVTDMRLIEKLVLFIGYLAQDICLNNARTNVYNRPLKQLLNVGLWRKLDKNNTIDNYMQFYAVITGKCI